MSKDKQFLMDVLNNTGGIYYTVKIAYNYSKKVFLKSYLEIRNSEQITDKCKDIIFKYTNIMARTRLRYVSKKTGEKTYFLEISGNDNIEKIGAWLYQDCASKIKLTKSYKAFAKILEERKRLDNITKDSRVQWLSYEEAKETMRSLNIQSSHQWVRYLKTNGPINLMPFSPVRVYKNTNEWVSRRDFWGIIKPEPSSNNVKICSKCTIEKPKAKFRKYSSICKSCKNIGQRSYRAKNPDQTSGYYNKPEAKKYHKEYRKKYQYKYNVKTAQDIEAYKLYRSKINKWQNKKRKEDIQFYLAKILRGRLYNALKSKNARKAGSAVRDLGCTIPELKLHLESKFTNGMSWPNRGKWHIDHIKPLSSFDLTDRQQLLEACNWKNLQPLWAIDNIKKGNKLS